MALGKWCLARLAQHGGSIVVFVSLMSIVPFLCLNSGTKTGTPEDLRPLIQDNRIPIVLDQKIGDYRLIVDSYGSPLELVRLQCLKGTGFGAYVFYRNSTEPTWTGGQGELGWPLQVDYSELGKGILTCTQFTWDPREYEDVPLYRTGLRIANGKIVKREHKLLLKEEDLTPSQIEALKEKIVQFDVADDCNGILEESCQHLRNFAVHDPGKARSIFGELLAKMKGVGSGETVNDYKNEVDVIAHLVAGYEAYEAFWRWH